MSFFTLNSLQFSAQEPEDDSLKDGFSGNLIFAVQNDIYIVACPN